MRPLVMAPDEGSRLRIESASVVFPQPLSPTTASVSPRWRVRSTPSTAFTTRSRSRYCTCRSSIRRIGSIDETASAVTARGVRIARVSVDGCRRSAVAAQTIHARQGALVAASDRGEHLALDLDVLGFREDRLHGRVSGLETDA